MDLSSSDLEGLQLPLERQLAQRQVLPKVIYLSDSIVAKPGQRKRLERELTVGRRLADIQIPAPEMHEVVHLIPQRRSFLLMSRLYGEHLTSTSAHKPYVELLRQTLIRVITELDLLPIDGEFNENVFVCSSGQLALIDFEYWRQPKSRAEKQKYVNELQSSSWTPNFALPSKLN